MKEGQPRSVDRKDEMPWNLLQNLGTILIWGRGTERRVEVGASGLEIEYDRQDLSLKKEPGVSVKPPVVRSGV